MKSLRTCAAIAVATALAHEHLADAIPYIGRVRAEDDGSKNVTGLENIPECVNEINTWRKNIYAEASDYIEIDSSESESESSELLRDKTCGDLRTGNFDHIADDDSETVFVFSAVKPADSRSDMTCQDAIKQWESGFGAFKGQYPPKYQESDEVYENNPNAVGLVALLQKDAQNISCGSPKECTTKDTIVCYIKPFRITEGEHPVTPELWHMTEEYFKTKPSLVAQEKGVYENYLAAVNAVRNAAGLELAKFTGPTDSADRRVKRQSGSPTPYENFLYELTCDDIDNSNIYPAAAKGYTIIYATKEGEVAPTPEEAVAHWESGFEKLAYNIPPAFVAKSDQKPEEDAAAHAASEEASQIYYDSAVAGYVSLMADDARKMRCYNATGCTKAALVCVLHEATLVDSQPPISEETWRKILQTKGITKPTFAARAESENCLEEINAVRTQESIALKPFVAATKAEKSESATVVSSLMSAVTCETLKAASVKATDSQTSLMYHSGSEGTCAEAVEAWKQGFGKFTEIPPAYNATAAIYQDGVATNFVSLMSDGENTQATCYTASGCSDKAVVCELSPAALQDGKKPISEENWEKVSETMKANGATASFSGVALLSSAVLAVVAAALQL